MKLPQTVNHTSWVKNISDRFRLLKSQQNNIFVWKKFHNWIGGFVELTAELKYVSRHNGFMSGQAMQEALLPRLIRVFTGYVEWRGSSSTLLSERLTSLLPSFYHRFIRSFVSSFFCFVQLCKLILVSVSFPHHQ